MVQIVVIVVFLLMAAVSIRSYIVEMQSKPVPTLADRARAACKQEFQDSDEQAQNDCTARVIKRRLEADNTPRLQRAYDASR